MKFWGTLITAAFLTINHHSFAATAKSITEPSLTLPRNLTNSVTNYYSKDHSNLTCHNLVYRTWSYPDATITPFCNEAEVSCLRYGFIRKAIALKKKGVKLPLKLSDLQRDLKLALNEVRFKLRGCQLALDYITGGPIARGATNIQEGAGFYSNRSPARR